MRSCYPDFTVGKLCATAISLVEDTSTAGLDEGPVDDMEEEESSAYKKIHQKPMTSLMLLRLWLCHGENAVRR